MQSKHMKQAEALFVAKQTARELSASHSSRALIFGDIVGLARGEIRPNANELMAKINQSLSARRQYIALSKQFSFDISPAQAAASTGSSYKARISNNFELKFKRDTYDESQVFALLKITFPNETHYTQGVIVDVMDAANETVTRVEFPILDEGKTQLLLEESSDILVALQNMNAEIVVH